jgi:hypothetical protein
LADGHLVNAFAALFHGLGTTPLSETEYRPAGTISQLPDNRPN